MNKSHLLLSLLLMSCTANSASMADGLFLQQEFGETSIAEDHTSSTYYDINTRTLYTIENLIGESWTSDSTELTLFLIKQSFSNCKYISEIRDLYKDEPTIYESLDTMLNITQTVLRDGKVIGVHTLNYNDCIDGGKVTPVNLND